MTNLSPAGVDSYGNFTGFANRTAPQPPQQRGLDVGAPGFLGYYLALLLTVAVGLALVVLALAGLCCNRHRIQTSIAAFLVNQLAACMVVVGASLVITLQSVALTIVKMSASSSVEGSVNTTAEASLLSLCHFSVWLYGVGSIGRLWSQMAFSVAVWVTLRYGPQVFRWAHLVGGAVAVWAATLLLNLHVAIPYPVYSVHFVDGVGCFPRLATIPPATLYSTSAVWILFGGLLPLAVSIVIPAIILCYVHRNTVSQDSRYNCAIARFALFLVAGNIVNLIGQVIPGLLAIQADSEPFSVLLSSSAIPLSYIPTPAIIIAFFKPVRERLKAIVCCDSRRDSCCCCRQQQQLSRSRSRAAGLDSAHGPGTGTGKSQCVAAA